MNTSFGTSTAVSAKTIQTEKVFVANIHQKLELPGECRLGECEGKACIVIGDEVYAPALVWVKRIRHNQWEQDGQLAFIPGQASPDYSLEQRELGIDFEI